jgi:hypothetical protein
MTNQTAYLNIIPITAKNCNDFGGQRFIGQFFGYIIHGATEYQGEQYSTQDAAIDQLRSDAADLGFTDIITTIDE